jgi:hypothetical protein
MKHLIAAGNDAAHINNVVERFARYFGGRALRRMCAHSIAHRMGHEPVLHCATACGEGLLVEPREQEGCTQAAA